MGVFSRALGNEEKEKKELNKLVNDVKQEIETAQERVEIDEKIIEEAEDAIGKINDLEEKEEQINEIIDDMTGSRSVGMSQVLKNPDVVQQKKPDLETLAADLNQAFDEAEDIEREISDIHEKIGNEIDLEAVEREDLGETAKLVSRVEEQQREADKRLQSLNQRINNTDLNL